MPTRQGEATGVEVAFDRRDSVLFVSVSGRLEVNSAMPFLEAVRAEIADDDRAVIVDFEKLKFLGSAGLRVIFMIAADLQKRDARLALCSPPKPIAKVIRLSGMENMIPVHPSRADAFHAL